MPTNISTNSEPDMEKNGTLASPATALASMVLPVPGGPTSRMPLGMEAPISCVLAGVVQVIHDLLQVFLGFVLTGHIGKADAVGGLDIDLGVGLAHAAEHHGARAAAGLFHQLFVHVVAQCHKDDGWAARS